MNLQKQVLKCALIGDPSVGKTSLMERVALNKFTKDMSSTIGVDYRVISIRGVQPVDVQVWDTAGCERFRAITQTYYRNIDCALVAYSSQDPASLDAVVHWVRDIRAVDDGTPILLIATKYDERPIRVSEEDAYQIANNLDLHGPVFTSAKTMNAKEVQSKIKPFFRAIVVSRNNKNHDDEGFVGVHPIEFCAGRRRTSRTVAANCCTIM